MKADTATLEGFIGSLQFKLGHVAGNAQQLWDLIVADQIKDDSGLEARAHLLKLIKEIQDAVFHVHRALKEVSDR